MSHAAIVGTGHMRGTELRHMPKTQIPSEGCDRAERANVTHNGFHWGMAGRLHQHIQTIASSPLLFKTWPARYDTVAQNRESYTEEPFGVISPNREHSLHPLPPQKCLTCHCLSRPCKMFPFFLPSLYCSIPTAGSYQSEGKQTQWWFFNWIVRSFNNSCKIKGQRTFVKSLHPERSTGGLWRTLHCKVCSVILSCLCVCPCRWVCPSFKNTPQQWKQCQSDRGWDREKNYGQKWNHKPTKGCPCLYLLSCLV